MSGSGDYISREALVNEIWKALYSYEDEMEAKFMADPELDVSQWFFHRIFVQAMSSIDLQVILDAPAADVRPVVRGKWTRIDYEPFGNDYICSFCGCKNDRASLYCPDCRAQKNMSIDDLLDSSWIELEDAPTIIPESEEGE